ncbi:MAG: hypothetical protein KGH72_04840 [Candidatus Micrarchaeota archaeon]|nr:hypothetical protein [Candidatus Micrarchaeota archaeon]
MKAMTAEGRKNNRWLIIGGLWAITIVVIIAVIIFLFTVGPGPGTPYNTTCLAQSGYFCSNPVFRSTSGNLLVTVGQDSGSNWTSANVLFLPAGYSTSRILAPSYFIAANSGIAYKAITGGLMNGQTMQITVPVNDVVTDKPYYPVGSALGGTLWVEYTISGYNSSSDYFAQLATVSLKAS